MNPRQAVLLHITLIVLLLGGTALVKSQDKNPVDEVLALAAAAVGSPKEIRAVQRIEAVADCIGPKGRYTTSLTSYRDDRTRFEQTYSYRDQPSSVFVNGDIVWESPPGSGQPALSTPFQRMAARAHEYQKMVLEPRAFFRDLKLAGDEMFDGRPSVKVSSKNELGMTTLLYFDKENKRFNGYVLELPGSSETVRNVILGWRRVGKLMLPSVVRATDKEGEWTLRFHTIKLNAPERRSLDVPLRIADLAELHRLHEQQKHAHLNYNAELFTEMFAERLIQLQRGNAVTRTRAENLTRFKTYFSGYKFIEWEDIVPPVFKISRDGTLATKIVQKRVRGTYKNEKGEDESDHTIFAWLEVWEKIAGRWQVTAVASTEKNGDK